MAPSGYRRSRLGAVRCSHCRIGDRPGDDDRDIRPRRRGPPGCQADATAAAGRGPRRAPRDPRGQGAAGHRPDRAPLRGRHGDPAPGGRALAGGRAAVPRERVHLAAGRHAAVPLPAVRAALLRAADRSCPGCSSATSPSRSCWRARSRPAGVSRSRGSGCRWCSPGHPSPRRSSGRTSRCCCSRRSSSCSIRRRRAPWQPAGPRCRRPSRVGPLESAGSRRSSERSRSRSRTRGSTSSDYRPRAALGGALVAVAIVAATAGPHRDRPLVRLDRPAAARRRPDLGSRWVRDVRGSCRRASARRGRRLPRGGLVRPARAGGRVDRRPVGGRLAVAPHLRTAVPRAGDARSSGARRRSSPRSSSRRTPTRGRGPGSSSSRSRSRRASSAAERLAATSEPRRMTPMQPSASSPGELVRAAPRRPARPPHARTTGQVLFPPARAAAVPRGRRLEHGLRIRRVGPHAVPARRLP